MRLIQVYDRHWDYLKGRKEARGDKKIADTLAYLIEDMIGVEFDEEADQP